MLANSIVTHGVYWSLLWDVRLVERLAEQHIDAYGLGRAVRRYEYCAG